MGEGSTTSPAAGPRHPPAEDDGDVTTTILEPLGHQRQSVLEISNYPSGELDFGIWPA